jgi:hypothetical protein
MARRVHWAETAGRYFFGTDAPYGDAVELMDQAKSQVAPIAVLAESLPDSIVP